MISQVLSQADLTVFARISLILFVGFYILAVFWILHPKRKPINDRVANQILEDDITPENIT